MNFLSLPRVLRAYGVLVCFAGLALVASSLQAQVPSSPGVIKVVGIRGAVTAVNRTTQTTVALTNGVAIEQNMVVMTGAASRAMVLFSNGSSVTLGPDALLDVEAYLADPFAGSPADLAAEPSTSATKLKLSYGQVTTAVKKLNFAGGSNFEIETPLGAAGVRGTEFRLTYTPSEGRLYLEVREGHVVLNIPGTDEISATDGETIEILGEFDAQGNLTNVRVTRGELGAAAIAEIIAAIQEAYEEMLKLIFAPGPVAGGLSTAAPLRVNRGAPPLVLPAQPASQVPSSPSS